MDNLLSILFISGLAFFLPVAAARFVVGARWHVVTIACLIWYGFLALAFGVFQGRDPVGWSLLVAVMFSLIAVPLIAAVLKVWNWLGRSNVGVAATGPSLQLLQRLAFSLVSPAQWSAIILIVTGGFLGSYWYQQRDLNARAELAGRFLGLPAGTSFAAFQSSNSSANAPSIAAIVRFTKPQFEAFVAQMGQAPPWQQGPPHYDGAPVEVVSPKAITWRDGPLLKRAGDKFGGWNELSSDEMRTFKRGRALCIALQRKPGSTRSTHSNDTPRYYAIDCSETGETERVERIVVGALDFDTRTLHMIIK